VKSGMVQPVSSSSPGRCKYQHLARRVFSTAGILLIGFTAYTYAARNLWQAFENSRLDRGLASHAAEPGDTRNSAEQGRETAASSVAPHALIGRIVIPRLHIAAIIREGVDERTLDLAVGHIPLTVLPGQQGNVGVAAHRDTLFRNRKDIKLDDEITLTTLDNTYAYRVVSFRVVNPAETSVLKSSKDEKVLTLVTCYPFYFVGHAPRRFIVRATQLASISHHRSQSQTGMPIS
jgi:sortase A